MNIPSLVSPWKNLHVYFTLALMGSNLFILSLILFIIYFISSFSLIAKVIAYVFISLLLSSQFICIYFSPLTTQLRTPTFRQLFSNTRIRSIIQLSLFYFTSACLFYYIQPFGLFNILYGLCFVIFAPAIVNYLLSNNRLFSFMANNLSEYLCCLINIMLMGLGYETVIYYADTWLESTFMPVIQMGLGAYLFLVSAYLIAHLGLKQTPLELKNDNLELTYLKKHISSGDHEAIHDFFKASMLSNRSEYLLDFYLKFLFSTQDKKNIQSFGKQWLTLLFNQKNIKKSVSVYQSIFKKNPDFCLSEPLINYPLAQHFMLTKQFNIVIHLLKDLPKESPNFRHMPEILYILAQAYLELNLALKSQQAIEFLLQTFPQSEQYAQALILKKILQTNAPTQP